MSSEFAAPTNSFMFNKGGKGQCVYNGRGITKTGQSSTGATMEKVEVRKSVLFRSFVLNCSPKPLKELFKSDPGFFAFRTVRHMGFVDYATISDATFSMRKHQGHRFRDHLEGILIDYDKDPRSKRNREFEKQIHREATRDEQDLVSLDCAVCRATCMKLKLESNALISQLPKRKVDQAIVVDTEKFACEVALSKGEVKALKREAGVEKQYRFKCPACGCVLAYASTPFEQKAKHVFFMSGAVRASDGSLDLELAVTRAQLAAAVATTASTSSPLVSQSPSTTTPTSESACASLSSSSSSSSSNCGASSSSSDAANSPSSSPQLSASPAAALIAPVVSGDSATSVAGTPSGSCDSIAAVTSESSQPEDVLPSSIASAK